MLWGLMPYTTGQFSLDWGSFSNNIFNEAHLVVSIKYNSDILGQNLDLFGKEGENGEKFRFIFLFSDPVCF